MTGLLSPFSYPLAVIDFEASALTLDSYPIEVGIAIVAAPASAVDSWSALIKPDTDWNMEARWDPDAQRVHGISRWDLREGISPRAAVLALNARIPSGSTVFCDGGNYDAHWLAALAQAADLAPTFQLADLRAQLREDEQLWTRLHEALGNTSPPHRAGPDALRLCAALHQAITSRDRRWPD